MRTGEASDEPSWQTCQKSWPCRCMKCGKKPALTRRTRTFSPLRIIIGSVMGYDLPLIMKKLGSGRRGGPVMLKSYGGTQPSLIAFRNDSLFTNQPIIRPDIFAISFDEPFM